MRIGKNNINSNQSQINFSSTKKTCTDEVQPDRMSYSEIKRDTPFSKMFDTSNHFSSIFCLWKKNERIYFLSIFSDYKLIEIKFHRSLKLQSVQGKNVWFELLFLHNSLSFYIQYLKVSHVSQTLIHSYTYHLFILKLFKYYNLSI